MDFEEVIIIYMFSKSYVNKVFIIISQYQLIHSLHTYKLKDFPNVTFYHYMLFLRILHDQCVEE